MLSPRRPAPEVIATALAGLSTLQPHPDISGREGSSTATIGGGAQRFERAATALLAQAHLQIPRTEVLPHEQVTPGARRLVVARRFGLWTFGPVEIVDVTAEDTRVAYRVRTLTGHPLRGWEEFELVHRPDGPVTFTVRAVARPAAWWVWPILPVIRRLQVGFRSAVTRRLRAASGGSDTV